MDNIILYGPGGASPLNIGSWLRADPGPEFGDVDLIRPKLVENALVAGGQFAHESVGMRRMSFPLTLASSGVGALPIIERVLALNARSGGYVDVQTFGVASAAAMRFDVVAGRWEPAYGIRHNEAGRRFGTLRLETQPYGYWPTWIILASSASVGLPGSIDLPLASIIGDAPGPIRLGILPSTPNTYSGGSWYVDMVAWGLSGAPSAPFFWSGGSLPLMANGYQGSILGVEQAIGSQAFQVTIPGNDFPGVTGTPINGWRKYSVLRLDQSSNRVPLVGRYRVFLWARQPSVSATPMQFTGNVSVNDYTNAPLASSAPVATVTPAMASISGGSVGAWGANASPAFCLLDLGVYTFPHIGLASVPVVGGLQGGQTFEIWGRVPSHSARPTHTIELGGIAFLSEGQAGVMARGLGASVGNVVKCTGLNIRSAERLAWTMELVFDASTTFAAGPGAQNTRDDALAHYRGVFPHVGPTTLRLDLLGAARAADVAYATSPAIRSGQHYAQVSLTYQPRFRFLQGI